MILFIIFNTTKNTTLFNFDVSQNLSIFYCSLTTVYKLIKIPQFLIGVYSFTLFVLRSILRHLVLCQYQKLSVLSHDRDVLLCLVVGGAIVSIYVRKVMNRNIP